MQDAFNRDMFVEAIGTSFKLTTANNAVDIELNEVSDLKETAAQQVFSIVFLVPEPFMVEQGLYDLEHPTLGPMQLFLSPVGIDEGRMQLEAVFNLLRPRKKEKPSA
jgi:hypothetical protein